MRYFFWRTVNTIPPISDPWNFVPGVLLYTAELYSTIMLAISLFVVADPLDRKPPPQLADGGLCRRSTSISPPTTRTPSCWR